MPDEDIEDPVDYGSIVRNNLMKRPCYAPYCGGCNRFDRAVWDGEQFRHLCGWRSEFPAKFIAGYVARWSPKPPKMIVESTPIRGDDWVRKFLGN